MKIAGYYEEDNIRHFHLIAEPVKHNILPSIVIDGLVYNGVIPGPLIIIKEGQWIYITVENKLDKPTSLHVHGLAKPVTEDGVPDINPYTPRINPGESYTYKFLCWQSGTFFYHSSDITQISQGMIGAFVVLPNNDQSLKIPDKDYVLLIQAWEIHQKSLGKIYPGTFKPSDFEKHPNFFTINGKAFPHTSPMYFKEGEKIRIRFITKSSESHSMHLHGHDFKIIHEDGFERPGFYDDTVDIASGKRIDVEMIANNPGVWPLNGTKTFHQTNNGESPGGMITKVIYLD